MDKVAAWWEGYDSLLRKPPAHSWCSPLILAGAYGVCLTHGNTSLCESSLPSKTLRAGVLRCGTLQNSTKNRFCQCFFAPYISSRSIMNSFISPTINTRHLIGVSMRRELPRPSQHRATPPEVRESACHSQHITTHTEKNSNFSTSTHENSALYLVFAPVWECCWVFWTRRWSTLPVPPAELAVAGSPSAGAGRSSRSHSAPCTLHTPVPRRGRTTCSSRSRAPSPAPRSPSAVACTAGAPRSRKARSGPPAPPCRRAGRTQPAPRRDKAHRDRAFCRLSWSQRDSMWVVT